MCTGHWSWNVLNALGTITTDLSYMWSRDPRGEKLHQRGLSSVSRLWINCTQKREDVGNQTVFIPHSKEENEFDDWFFIPFKLLYYYFILFVILCFSIKFLKRYLLSGFVASIYYLSTVIQLIISYNLGQLLFYWIVDVLRLCYELSPHVEFKYK